MTAYDISSFTSKNLALICSSSAGSIQTALKKLLKSDLVSVEELTRGSINKRIYSITEAGKKDFNGWIISPMQASKAKNIKEITFIKNKSAVENLHVNNAQNILNFQEATLDFGIDSADFEINWYKNLLKKTEK